MRDGYIDFLRFIGLALIVFAHVGPPYALFQLRNFDVPLMVIVSALSFLSSSGRKERYFNYVGSRVLRLCAPVWVFLTAYFVGVYIFDPISSDLQIRAITTSYFFLEGIGYVWIIRVFLLVALMAPFIIKWNEKVTSHQKYFSGLAFIYSAYEISYFVTSKLGFGGWFSHVSDVVYYIVPYSLIFAFGLRMPQFSQKSHMAILATAASLFAVLATYLWQQNGEFVQTQDYKYPPRLYYLLFALIGCEFMWLCGRQIWSFIEKNNILRNVVLFYAQNSLWVYLWHIPFIKYLHLNFAAEYIVVLAAAGLCAFVQVNIINHLVIPRIDSVLVQRRIRMVLTG